MKQPKYTYTAIPLRAVDGDTLDMMVDLGFSVWLKVRVRLFGVDTPETYGVKKESAEYKAGKAATRFVEAWLGLGQDSDPEPVIITSHDGKEIGQGKYGRWIVDVYKPDGQHLNGALLAEGHATAVSYD